MSVVDEIFVEFALAVAVTFTRTGAVPLAGGVYRPVSLSMVSMVAFPPVASLSAQVSKVLSDPETVAMNCWVLVPKVRF